MSERHGTNATEPLIRGWVPSPDGRGTPDILVACLATVFLCTYSVLFLNIKPHKTRTAVVLYKAKWVFFTVFFPEVTVAIAAEQWRAARESVADFEKLRKQWEDIAESSRRAGKIPVPNTSLTHLQNAPWSARHALFADMGALHLRCPDFPPFPISSAHFRWLIEHGHTEYPELEEKAIMEGNKADTLTRFITLLQVTWFTVQVIARGIKHLSITTLELSTLAFACCTLHAIWFWRDKALDVTQPIEIVSKIELRAIIGAAGLPARGGRRYETTPLDFLDTQERVSFVDPFFFAMGAAVNQKRNTPALPATYFGNDRVSHKSVKPCDIFYGHFFVVLYFGIHFAAWPLPFPTEAEMILWRGSAITLAIIGVMYGLVVWPGNLVCRNLIPGKPKNAIEMAKSLPPWAFRLLLWPMIVAYFLARTFIVVEGFVSLRALPASAYTSVNWSSFVPHY